MLFVYADHQHFLSDPVHSLRKMARNEFYEYLRGNRPYDPTDSLCDCVDALLEGRIRVVKDYEGISEWERRKDAATKGALQSVLFEADLGLDYPARFTEGSKSIFP